MEIGLVLSIYMLTCHPGKPQTARRLSTPIRVSKMKAPLKILRKSYLLRPFTPSRDGLSDIVNPWYRLQCLTTSRILNLKLSKVVIP